MMLTGIKGALRSAGVTFEWNLVKAASHTKVREQGFLGSMNSNGPSLR